MADQPVISNSDLSEIAMFNNTFGDRTVTVPAATTLAKYTVLGWDATAGELIACESDNAVGADAPTLIVMQEIVNETAGAVDYSNIRVMLEGEFDADLIVFANGTDTLDTANTAGILLRDGLKTEGLIAVERNDLSKLDNQ